MVTSQKKAPWKQAAGVSDEQQALHRGEVLFTAFETLRIITALLHPFLPNATTKVWRQLGLGEIAETDFKNLKWEPKNISLTLPDLAPIFPRADKGLAQIMTDMESPTTPPKARAPQALPLRRRNHHPHLRRPHRPDRPRRSPSHLDPA